MVIIPKKKPGQKGQSWTMSLDSLLEASPRGFTPTTDSEISHFINIFVFGLILNVSASLPAFTLFDNVSQLL